MRSRPLRPSSAREPENAAAYAGLIRCHLASGDLDQAEAYAAAAPAAIAKAKEIEGARAQIELARQAAKAGPVTELSRAVEADPANHQARFDLALALHASGQIDEAVDQLLELFRRDREWNEGAARTQLFTIFDALEAHRSDRSERTPPALLDDICLIDGAG